MDTSPTQLLDLPVELQEKIYDYSLRSDDQSHQGQKVVQLILGGVPGRPYTTIHYPDALLQTCRTIRDITVPLLSKGLTLDVRSYRSRTFEEVIQTVPAVFLPYFSDLTLDVATEQPHAFDLSKFPSLENVTFDLRRVLDSRINMSLHLPDLDSVESARVEVAQTLRDWRSWYPHHLEGNMQPILFEWLNHVGRSTSSESFKEVKVSSSYFFDIEIRDCESVVSEPFDRVRVHFEVTRKLRVHEGRNLWDTELIYVIDSSPSSDESPGDYLASKSLQAQNVVQALTQEIGQHYPTIEIKAAY